MISYRKVCETHSIYDSVEVLQALLLEDSGVHVVFEVSVVDRQTDAVQAKGCEAFSILFGEEVVEELYANGWLQQDGRMTRALTRTKKYSYFSSPRTFLRDFRTWSMRSPYVSTKRQVLDGLYLHSWPG